MKHFLALALGIGLAGMPQLSYAVEQNQALGSLSADVILPVPASAWKAAGELSCELWVSPDSGNASATILRLGKAELGLAGGVLCLKTSEQTLAGEHTAFAAGSWHHVAVSLSGGAIELFVDNVSAGKFEDPALAATLLDNWRGVELAGNFPGRRDELRLWDCAMGVGSFFLNGPLSIADKRYADLIGVWHLDGDFEDGKWTRQFDAVGLLYPEAKKPAIASGNALFSGILPDSGVSFESAVDNTVFRYSFLQGYVRGVHVLYDWISREHLISSSELIYVGAVPQANGWVDFSYPDNDATAMAGVSRDASYTDHAGKSYAGITSFGGQGAVMKVGTGLFTTSLIGSSKFTIETRLCLPAWVSGAKIFENEAVSLRCGSIAGEFVIQVGTSAWKVTVADFPLNGWFHLAVTRNGGNPSVYFNKAAQTVATATASTLPAAGTESVVGENLSAKMDYLRIWGNEARNVSDLDGTIRTAWADRNLCARWEGEILGRDTASWVEHIRMLKRKLAGTKGTRITLCIAGGGWKEFVVKTASGTGWNGQNARWAFGARLKELYLKYGPDSSEPIIDGFDLDFEWPETDALWTAYANTISVVRQVIPAKTFFSNSLHALYYKLPNITNGNVKTHDALDLINCQNYGPQQAQNKYANFTQAYNNCVNYGLPKHKLVFSTPVQGTAVQSGDSNSGNYIKTWREIYATAKDAGATIENSTDSIPYTFSISGNTVSRNISIVGVDSTAKRAQFIYDKGLPGIMYWDMGEDVAYDSGTGNKTNQSGPGDLFHPFSLVASMSRVLGTTVFPKREKTLAIQSAGIHAGKTALATSLKIRTNQAWALSVPEDANWIKPGAYSGNGDAELALEIAEADLSERSAVLTIVAEDGQSQSVEVTQVRGDVRFELSDGDAWESVSACGGTKEFEFTTNLDAGGLVSEIAEEATDWLSAEFKDGKLQICVCENTTVSERSGVVRIKGSAGNVLAEITVSQEAAAAFFKAQGLAVGSGASRTDWPVESNTKWKVLGASADWLSVESPALGNEQRASGSLSLSIDENGSVEPREAGVKIAWLDGARWRETVLSVTQAAASPVLETEISQWSAPRESATKQVAVRTNIPGNCAVRVLEGGEWLICTAGNNILRLALTENTGASTRTGRVEVSAGALSRIITVTQEGLHFSLDKTSISAEAVGGTQTLVVTANCGWTISAMPAWMSASALSGGNGTTQVKLTIEASALITARAGSLVFEYCGKTETIPVRQAAGVSRPVQPEGGDRLPAWDGGLMHDSIVSILIPKAGELREIVLPFETEGLPFVLDPEWLLCDLDKGTLYLEAGPNTQGEVRETYVFLQVKGGGIRAFAVKQIDK